MNTERIVQIYSERLAQATHIAIVLEAEVAHLTARIEELEGAPEAGQS